MGQRGVHSVPSRSQTREFLRGLSLLGACLSLSACPNFFAGKPKPVSPPQGGQPERRDGYLRQTPVMSWSGAQLSRLRSLKIQSSVRFTPEADQIISETADSISVRITIDFQSQASESFIAEWTAQVASISTLSGKDQTLRIPATLENHPCSRSSELQAPELSFLAELQGLCVRRIQVVIPKNSPVLISYEETPVP